VCHKRRERGKSIRSSHGGKESGECSRRRLKNGDSQNGDRKIISAVVAAVVGGVVVVGVVAVSVV